MNPETCTGDCPTGCDGDHGMSLGQENRWLWSENRRLKAELDAARAAART